MTTFQRDEQKAIDLLDKAEVAVLGLGFEVAEVDAIKSTFFGIKNYVINLAVTRENNPPAPEGEYRTIDVSDQGEGKDTLGQHDQ